MSIPKYGLMIWALLLCGYGAPSQTDTLASWYHAEGQVSAFLLYNPDNALEFFGGARYLPQFNWEKPLPEKQLLDLEVSANIFGTFGLHPFDSTTSSGDIRPYRAWVRYARPQFELRAGLQKINFGSAAILRPLMWFDQIDPRDPLQLTDGVWGILGRYYFLNNANIWLWSLYGNADRRGFDSVPSDHHAPEFGGRFQFPTKGGEAALTYHYRKASLTQFNHPVLDRTPEHRFALDGKWDLGIGLWTEVTWIHKTQKVGLLTNQHLLNLGADYTFGIGNGLNLIVEQLVLSFAERAFSFNRTNTLTALSTAYPIGLFDQLSAIVYYDWTGSSVYNTLQWQHAFAKWNLHVLAFWNPKNSQLPQQQFTENLFGGKGIQLLAIYHH